MNGCVEHAFDHSGKPLGTDGGGDQYRYWEYPTTQWILRKYLLRHWFTGGVKILTNSGLATGWLIGPR